MALLQTSNHFSRVGRSHCETAPHPGFCLQTGYRRKTLLRTVAVTYTHMCGPEGASSDTRLSTVVCCRFETNDGLAPARSRRPSVEVKLMFVARRRNDDLHGRNCLNPVRSVQATLWRAPFLQHIEERSAAKETKTYIPQIMW